MLSSSDKTSALTSAHDETSRDRPSCTDEKLRTVSVLSLRFCCVRWYPLWRIFCSPHRKMPLHAQTGTGVLYIATGRGSDPHNDPQI
jgi:hypothetical protein